MPPSLPRAKFSACTLKIMPGREAIRNRGSSSRPADFPSKFARNSAPPLVPSRWYSSAAVNPGPTELEYFAIPRERGRRRKKERKGKEREEKKKKREKVERGGGKIFTRIEERCPGKNLKGGLSFFLLTFVLIYVIFSRKCWLLSTDDNFNRE